jgi:hypothetical protein
MRILLFLGVLAVVGLVVTGAIKLQSSADNTISIQIDKDRVKEDAGIVVRKGKEAIREASEAFRESGNKETQR